MLSESNSNFLIAFFLSFLFMYMVLAAPVREPGSSHHNPAGIAADVAIRFSVAVFAADQFRYLRGLWPLHALRHREKEWHFADRLHERPPFAWHGDRAILEANKTRLRPILMTTLMLIAAMVPIALGQGPGIGRWRKHGQSHHRWPRTVPAFDSSDNARCLLAVG